MALRLGRYFWKFFFVNAFVMALVLSGCVWVITSRLNRLGQEELSRQLHVQAATLKVVVSDQFNKAHAQELAELANRVGSIEGQGARVTFILADGTVVGDSAANPAAMESHADRPEVQQALAGGSGEAVRWSHTVTKNMRYVALRVGDADRPSGVVRVSMAVPSLAVQSGPVPRLVLVIAIVSVLTAVILTPALTLLWSRRIQRITEAARSISHGDLSTRVELVGHDEVTELGRSLNEMCARLSVHLDTIDRQRHTLESLMSQLGEGVVVVDAKGRVLLMNSEAIDLLQVTPQRPDSSFVGLTIEQSVPQRKLQDILRPISPKTRSEENDRPVPLARDLAKAWAPNMHEVELQVITRRGVRTVLGRAFDVRLPSLTEADRSAGVIEHMGRALVLTDVTELTKAMRVKADLAANASHELRTPLSAIRAAVDTLHSIDPLADPANVVQFVDVVDRHSARMEAVIDDLLKLSRLESGSHRFEATTVSAITLVDDLQAMFADSLAAKRLQWNARIPDGDVTLLVSLELLRMILRNLIDNAIRFTDRGGEITLSVRPKGEVVVFEVSDTGCGIAVKDQQRIFERFYQVERARSGPDRGTGLGLSIVRHAATALGATIDLQSELGQGTRVAVHVPWRR